MSLGFGDVVFDEATDKALKSIPLRERLRVRGHVRRHRRQFMKDAIADWIEAQPEEFETVNFGVGEEDEDDPDGPLIRFWKWAIENQVWQKFLRFLVEEFLPALFQLIIALIQAIVSIFATPAAKSAGAMANPEMPPNFITLG